MIPVLGMNGRSHMTASNIVDIGTYMVYCIYVPMCVHTYIHTCIRMCIHIYIHAYECAYTCTYIGRYVHTVAG